MHPRKRVAQTKIQKTKQNSVLVFMLVDFVISLQRDNKIDQHKKQEL